MCLGYSVGMRRPAATASIESGFQMARSETIPFQDLISKKRDGFQLTDKEMEILVQKVVNKEAEDSQIGAMLMAIFLRGMDHEETCNLTKHMVNTGLRMNWGEEWGPLLVDKHSTGGVGDKVSLSLAPALAACGLKVPMMSGRGLDFTGGTLDKLECIEGFKVQQTEEAMREALQDPGCFVVGPSKRIAPADGELYKRRDVTATVDSIPLVVSSIVSKKVAEGTRALVMDVKVGHASLFKTEEQASKLAEAIITVANLLGVKTKAVLTRMDAPIGRAVGNALEVVEAIESMQGKGPEDLDNLVATLGGVLLEMSGKAASLDHGKECIREALGNGTALRKFQRMLVKQGVSPDIAERVCRDPKSVLPRVPDGQITPIKSPSTGVVKSISGLAIAKACQRLGAGRERADQDIDFRVGVVLEVEEGTKVAKGDTLLVAHHAEGVLPEGIRQMLCGAVEVIRTGNTVPLAPDRVIRILS